MKEETKKSFLGRHGKETSSPGEKIGYLEFELRERKNQRSSFERRARRNETAHNTRRDDVSKKKLTRRKRKFRLKKNLKLAASFAAIKLVRRVGGGRTRNIICQLVLGDDRLANSKTFRRIRTNRKPT